MSAIANLNLRVDKLPKENFVKGKDGAVYVNLTLSLNNDSNQYGQNISAFVPQSKEEREAKKNRQYVGNGQIVWTDGTIKNAVKNQVKEEIEETSDFPF